MEFCSSASGSSWSAIDSDFEDSYRPEGSGSTDASSSELLQSYIDDYFDRRKSARRETITHNLGFTSVVFDDRSVSAMSSFATCKGKSSFEEGADTGLQRSCCESRTVDRPVRGSDSMLSICSEPALHQMSQMSDCSSSCRFAFHQSQHFQYRPASTCVPADDTGTHRGPDSIETTLCMGGAAPLSSSRRVPEPDDITVASLSSSLSNDLEPSHQRAVQDHCLHGNDETLYYAAIPESWHCGAAASWRLRQRIQLLAAGAFCGRILSTGEKANIRESLTRLQFGESKERGDRRRQQPNTGIGTNPGQGLSTGRLSKIMRGAMNLMSDDEL